MQQYSFWKLMPLVVVLVFFAAIGVAHVVKPDWLVGRSGVRKGGQMLTEWNRWNFQIVGALLAGVALWILDDLLSDYFSG